jgi:hypothetical protein
MIGHIVLDRTPRHFGYGAIAGNIPSRDAEKSRVANVRIGEISTNPTHLPSHVSAQIKLMRSNVWGNIGP